MLTAIRSLIRNLILPNNAGSSDPAIVLGPDLPSCMQAVYTSAIFFRPDGSLTTAGTGKCWHFWALQKSSGPLINSIVDEGYLISDSLGNCGYVVFNEYVSPVVGGGPGIMNPTQIYGEVSAGGIGTFGQTTLQYGGSGGTTGSARTNIFYSYQVDINFGDNTRAPKDTTIAIDGVSIGRGLRDQVSSTFATAGIGAETTVMFGNTITWFNGRAYRIEWVQPTLLWTVGGAFCDIRVRRTNLAGPLLNLARYAPGTTAGMTAYGFCIVRNTSGSDIVGNLVQTMNVSAGTAVADGGTQPRTFTATDTGAAGDYPFAPQI